MSTITTFLTSNMFPLHFGASIFEIIFTSFIFLDIWQHPLFSFSQNAQARMEASAFVQTSHTIADKCSYIHIWRTAVQPGNETNHHIKFWVTWITYRENNHDQNIQNNRSHIPAVQIIFHSTHSHMFDRVKWSFSQKSHHYMAKFLAIGYRSAEEKNLMNALLKEFASSIMNSHLQKLSPRKLKTILIWKPSAITNCSFG